MCHSTIKDFVTRIQWIEGEYPWKVNNLEYINLFTTKPGKIMSFLLPT